MKRIISKAFSIIGLVILIGVILLCIPVTIPGLMGYDLYTVISGSMEPEIPVGSLIFVTHVEPSELVENDIIAFYGSDSHTGIVTHRVVENRIVEGQVITKGDANQQNDFQPVNYNRVIGIVVKHYPLLGYVAQLVSSIQGKIAVVALIIFGFLLNLISSKIYEKNVSV